jgi:hypothetical protein
MNKLVNLLVNLTPHALVLRVGETDLTLPPSGQVARVSVRQVADGSILTEAGEIPLYRSEYGAVEGLPAHEAGVVYLVSGLVAGRCQDRPDVWGPDTGPTAIREGGQVKAVIRLAK